MAVSPQDAVSILILSSKEGNTTPHCTACLHCPPSTLLGTSRQRRSVTSPRSLLALSPTSYTTHQHIMILTLSSSSVLNTVFTDERGLPVFKSDTPFRLGVRTTTISRQTSDRSKMEDPIEVVGRINWHYLGSSIFTIGGTKLESDAFLPSHGFFGW